MHREEIETYHLETLASAKNQSSNCFGMGQRCVYKRPGNKCDHC